MGSCNSTWTGHLVDLKNKIWHWEQRMELSKILAAPVGDDPTERHVLKDDEKDIISETGDGVVEGESGWVQSGGARAVLAVAAPEMSENNILPLAPIQAESASTTVPDLPATIRPETAMSQSTTNLAINTPLPTDEAIENPTDVVESIKPTASTSIIDIPLASPNQHEDESLAAEIPDTLMPDPTPQHTEDNDGQSMTAPSIAASSISNPALEVDSGVYLPLISSFDLANLLSLSSLANNPHSSTIQMQIVLSRT